MEMSPPGAQPPADKDFLTSALVAMKEAKDDDVLLEYFSGFTVTPAYPEEVLPASIEFFLHYRRGPPFFGLTWVKWRPDFFFLRGTPPPGGHQVNESQKASYQ